MLHPFPPRLMCNYSGTLRNVWPAASPDLSPIENVWAMVEHRLQYSKDHSWSTQLEFEQCIQAAWLKVTSDKEVVKHLYESMPKRMSEVVEAGGGRIKY